MPSSSSRRTSCPIDKQAYISFRTRRRSAWTASASRCRRVTNQTSYQGESILDGGASRVPATRRRDPDRRRVRPPGAADLEGGRRRSVAGGDATRPPAPEGLPRLQGNV